MTDNKKYKAFISYRHVEPDKKIAELLQKYLEQFRRGKGRWRIFRDESELPTSSDLSEDIADALKNSEYLICICSKKMTESRWCAEEIRSFKRLHDNSTKNILTILVNDTPEEAFLPELCTTIIEKTLNDGTVVKEEVEVEPLAANVTAKSFRAMKKKLKTEYLRIAAPLSDVSYDELYNRTRRRTMRKIIALTAGIGGVIAAASVGFGLYNRQMMLNIQNKNEQIEAQNAQILEQNTRINEQNTELERQNAEILEINRQQDLEIRKNHLNNSKIFYKDGNIRDAVKSAMLSFPQDEEGELIPESLQVLAEETGAYEKTSFLPLMRITPDEELEEMHFLCDGERLVGRDINNTIYLWDTSTGSLIRKIESDPEGQRIRLLRPHPREMDIKCKKPDADTIYYFKSEKTPDNGTILLDYRKLSDNETFVSDDETFYVCNEGTYLNHYYIGHVYAKTGDIVWDIFKYEDGKADIVKFSDKYTVICTMGR